MGWYRDGGRRDHRDGGRRDHRDGGRRDLRDWGGEFKYWSRGGGGCLCLGGGGGGDGWGFDLDDGGGGGGEGGGEGRCRGLNGSLGGGLNDHGCGSCSWSWRDGRCLFTGGAGGAQLDEIRSGNHIRSRDRVVDVQEDTGVIDMVGTGELDCRVWNASASARNFQVDTHWVKLSLARIERTVECKELVPHEVLTGFQLLGNGNSPGVVVCDDGV